MHRKLLIICGVSFFGFAGYGIEAQADPFGGGLKLGVAAPSLVETAGHRRCVPYGYGEGLSYCYESPRYDSYDYYSPPYRYRYPYSHSYSPGPYRELGFPENCRPGSKGWWEETNRLISGGG